MATTSDRVRRFSRLITNAGWRGRKLRPNPSEQRTERPLTDAQQASWDDQGFVVLPGLFSEQQVSRLSALVDELWEKRKRNDHDLIIDVFIGTPEERRIRFRNAPDEARLVPYK